ncbi:hypothetical protein HI914_00534 [Erysiphe necator]|nr:hypothetical protein HI914_00534 [Erysiphe necator]
MISRNVILFVLLAGWTSDETWIRLAGARQIHGDYSSIFINGHGSSLKTKGWERYCSLSINLTLHMIVSIQN